MARFSISLNVLKLSYSALRTLAQNIHDGFLAHALEYPAPTVTMLIFQGHIDDLIAAIDAWGLPHARGSHQQHVDLIAAANIVRDDLRKLSLYAMTTKPDDKDSWSSLGFAIKRPKSATAPLGMVRDLRIFISRLVPSTSIKLKWERPLDTDQGDIKVYVIQYNNTAVQPERVNGSQGIANVIGIVTDTSIILEPKYAGANFFWVTPFNAAGFGVSSDPLYYNAPAPPEE
jgi:hypothetical protein